MARCKPIHIAVWSLFATASANAQTAAGDDADEQRRRLIEQKVRLVESLMNAPAAAEATRKQAPETPALLALAKTFLERVRMALAANQMDEAARAADDALRNAIKTSAAKSAAQGDRAHQSASKNLAEQVATYRAALDELARQGNAEAKSALLRIDVLDADARKSADARQWEDAERKWAEAYKSAIESLSRLRAGQTVTLSLKFDTPAQEYDYERKRFQSAEILIAMMVDDGRAGERRHLVDNLLRDGRTQSVAAADLARADDYKGAVSTMENAVGLLNRALQVMGVPVF